MTPQASCKYNGHGYNDDGVCIYCKNSIKTTELRIGDKIIVLDGVNPMRFRFVNDPTKSLYQFDDKGNILYAGEDNR